MIWAKYTILYILARCEVFWVVFWDILDQSIATEYPKRLENSNVSQKQRNIPYRLPKPIMRPPQPIYVHQSGLFWIFHNLFLICCKSWCFLSVLGPKYYRRLPKDAWKFQIIWNFFETFPKVSVVPYHHYTSVKMEFSVISVISGLSLNNLSCFLSLLGPKIPPHSAQWCLKIQNIFKTFWKIPQRLPKSIFRPSQLL